MRLKYSKDNRYIILVNQFFYFHWLLLLQKWREVGNKLCHYQGESSCFWCREKKQVIFFSLLLIRQAWHFSLFLRISEFLEALRVLFILFYTKSLSTLWFSVILADLRSHAWLDQRYNGVKVWQKKKVIFMVNCPARFKTADSKNHLIFE